MRNTADSLITTFWSTGYFICIAWLCIMVNNSLAENIKNPALITASNPGVILKTGVTAYTANGRRQSELVFDITWSVERPVREVWPIFKDFNNWQNGYGFYYDGVMGNEGNGNLVYLSNKPNNKGIGSAYTVRKVIPEHMMYIESMPTPTGVKDIVFSGHNVATLKEENGVTHINFFMEHTWRSSEETEEELKKIAQSLTNHGKLFWQEHFLPDLAKKLESGR